MEQLESKAIFDPSKEIVRKLHPLLTPDSAHVVDTRGISIQRGEQGRLVAYFKLDPMFASQKTAKHVLNISYLDEGSGEWFIEYIPRGTKPGTSYPWISSRHIDLSASGKQKQVSVDLDNAQVTGAANGVDFRIIIIDPDIHQFRVFSASIEITNPADKSLPSSHAPEHDRFVRPSKSLNIVFSEIDEPKASIIIPVFNALEYTLDCLRAVAEFTQPIFEILIVDNGSTDETPYVLANIPWIRAHYQ